MEMRKLTKNDLDAVRDIEGFPIGNDDAIIDLSVAPGYTACPNPFINEFIEKNGKKYQEDDDTYSREPFTADVSEGKHDPMYMAHSYHTKVPFKAIMRYILHYTNPGDIVLDGFAGSGMTGVAAQMCGMRDVEIDHELSESRIKPEWGIRNAILADLSPEATFIDYNYNNEFDVRLFTDKAEKIIQECRQECDWMYKTSHFNDDDSKIEYVVWSDLYICSNCGQELNYWDIAVTPENKLVQKVKCPHCEALIDKNKCEHVNDIYYDKNIGDTVTVAKQVPVKIFYSYLGKRYSKNLDENDLEKCRKIEEIEIPYWYPTERTREGSESRRNDRTGVTHIHQFYTKRNLYVLSKCYDLIQNETDERIRRMLMFWFSSIYSRSHKLNRYMPNHNRHVGPLSGTLYMPYFQAEINIIGLLEDKLKAIQSVSGTKSNAIITTQSTTDLSNIMDNSIDYIFTDPPFGDNLNYSELNMIWEAWLKISTNNRTEAIINQSQNKNLVEYQELMTQCFKEYYRVLKPNRWMTVEFHNSKNAVWNAIQQSIQHVGFVIADVRTLDKQKGTTKQLSTTSAVQQDLVISAYKPTERFEKELMKNSGTQETAWEFVRNHLEKLPVVIVNNGQIEIIAERQERLLFDRMVAYHIIHGLPVPIDSIDFYRGLNERFLKRDSMFFLPDQVNEYDTARITNDVENIQFTFIVTNEKTAIAWLYQQLSDEYGGAKTYADIQPKFMQEVKSIDRYESLPELQTLLEENFLQDEKGKWYIPDTTKESDIEKLREKKLIKEFEGYMQSKGKLKLFRSEAIRVGFSMLWKDKNYQAIVDMAQRLPEATIQEDQNLLMYYDISLSRI